MALQASGAISLANLRDEFQDTNPVSMSEFYSNAGLVDPRTPANADVPTNLNGSPLDLGTFYNRIKEYIYEDTAGVGSLNVGSLYTSGEWQSLVPKRLLIADTSIVGPVTIPVDLGGDLTVDVYGEIQGLGGSANAGTGGNAITSYSTFNLTVQEGGAIRAGGGGGGFGGTGGTGGQGVYQVISTSSNYFVVNAMQFATLGQGYNNTIVQWTGGSAPTPWISNPISIPGTTVTSYYDAETNATYYRGSEHSREFYNGAWFIYYYIYRTIDVTTYQNGTAGSIGTAGGTGQGYGQAAVLGSIPSPASDPINNAGKGGTGGRGGIGGTWGTTGSTGSTGSNGTAGNYTNGTSGSVGTSGGAPGQAVYMVSGSSNVSNLGTINGAY
jgi:hypothetical protein